MISVVIPHYKDFENLSNTLKSINEQKEVFDEIIIVDDFSNDSSVDKIKNSFKDVKIITFHKHKGIAFVRNKCIKESKCDIILFVDSDIMLQKNCVNKLVSEIKNFDIVFPKIIFENKRVMHPLLLEEKIYPQITACFMIKRSAIKNNNLFFDETYSYCYEDADFFLRANLKNLKMKYIKSAVAVHKLKVRKNSEKRFYLENRNLLYGIKKFKKLKTDIYHPFHFSSLFKNFVCALFNYDKFDWSHYDRSSSFWQKFKLLFKKHRKITEKNRLILIYLFFKAVWWNIFYRTRTSMFYS
ncbi:MAG: glycosyltransferase [Nanoarchaeota archaeon]|nr:glycosyltransferase [Nanoarchaeota archaeon]